MPHILITEDEPSIAQSLEHVLQAEGFGVTCCATGGEALACVQTQNVDLIILDVGLPDTSGFEVCKQLRSFSELPVVFLTARGEEIDRVVGLEIGADDYVTKPFSPREVVARVRAILKRTMPSATPQGSPLPSTQLVHHPQQSAFSYCGQALQLTRAEYLLLHTMHQGVERLFSREQLLAALGLSQSANYDRSIDSHIKSLRAKLRAINGELSPIKTQRGFGYRLSWRDL